MHIFLFRSTLALSIIYLRPGLLNITSQPEVQICVFEFSFDNFGLASCCVVEKPYMTWLRMARLLWKHHKELTKLFNNNNQQ